MHLSILYRGPLLSCNYDCHYCPFAKQHDSAAELREDRLALARFTECLIDRPDDEFSVLFTPWGEALTRRWYRDAFVTLSGQRHIRKIAAQTNLSFNASWLAAVEPAKVALWCTFHPSQTRRGDFVRNCRLLDELGIRYSVGMVGLLEYFDEIKRLREDLPTSTYFWINAFKRDSEYYSDQQIAWLESIDPHFRVNTQYHRSFGRSCRTGNEVISVDGDGVIQRCHFVKSPLGNFYDRSWKDCLVDEPCPNQTCGCHIGYVHLDDLQLKPLYGDGILERIPRRLS